MQQRALRVDAGLAHHVVDEGDVIDHVPERGHHLRQLLATLAVGLEVPHRLEPRPESVLEGHDRAVRLDKTRQAGGSLVDVMGFGGDDPEVATAGILRFVSDVQALHDVVSAGP